MSKLRHILEQARDRYEGVRYPGDLADDVFARLDEQHALRISPAPRRRSWRPALALAAAVAVMTTTAVMFWYADQDRVTPIGGVAIAPPPVGGEASAQETENALAAADVETTFTVVPTYQSFAISVPASLTLASLDEYDQQSREQAVQTANEGQPTIQ